MGQVKIEVSNGNTLSFNSPLIFYPKIIFTICLLSEIICKQSWCSSSSGILNLWTCVPFSWEASSTPHSVQEVSVLEQTSGGPSIHAFMLSHTTWMLVLAMWLALASGTSAKQDKSRGLISSHSLRTLLWPILEPCSHAVRKPQAVPRRGSWRKKGIGGSFRQVVLNLGWFYSSQGHLTMSGDTLVVTTGGKLLPR